jgi:uncharacterized RDD family membrane protein YckC
VTSQPGWHPDPTQPPGAQPGEPAQLRYWDGVRWTEHTAPAPYQSGPGAYQGTYGAPPVAAGGSGYAAKLPPTTPDGVPLAGWWQRAGALLIDWVIVTAIVLVLALPWIRDIWHTYRDWFDDALNDGANGTTTSPDTSQLQEDIAGPAAIIGLITLALEFCYHVGFLMWKQATPGKLVVGLRVRLRERPGRLPFGAVLLRWLGQFGIRVVGLIPFVGSVTGLYLLLDYLWPLWDDKKQAIHDKIAKTNVVRLR